MSEFSISVNLTERQIEILRAMSLSIGDNNITRISFLLEKSGVLESDLQRLVDVGYIKITKSNNPRRFIITGAGYKYLEKVVVLVSRL